MYYGSKWLSPNLFFFVKKESILCEESASLFLSIVDKYVKNHNLKFNCSAQLMLAVASSMRVRVQLRCANSNYQESNH